MDVGAHYSKNPDGLSRYLSEILRALNDRNDLKITYVKRIGKNYYLEIVESKERIPLVDVISYGDVLLMPGLDMGVTEAASTLNQMKRDGLRIGSLVADVLGVDNPEWFPSHAKGVVTEYFGALSEISNFIVVPSVRSKRSLKLFQVRNGLQFPKIVVGHPGNDHFDLVDTSAFNSEFPYLLYISTIEPRKRHSELINSFLKSKFRDQGYRLHLIGKMGWLEPGDRKIFEKLIRSDVINYKSDINDSQLKTEILNSSAIIMASRDEGYGLSLMEGAYYQKPLFCSDIEVFREITLGYATFFNDYDKPLFSQLNEFADAIKSQTAVKVPIEVAKARTWKALVDIWLEECEISI